MGTEFLADRRSHVAAGPTRMRETLAAISLGLGPSPGPMSIQRRQASNLRRVSSWWVVPPFLFAAALLLAPKALLAQRVVHILEEPRHRTVWQDGDVRVLDVQINPGDTTLAHTHDSPIMYTFISSGSGSSNGRVSSNTNYASEPFTHSVSNAGPGLFRIIAIAHFGPGDPAVGGSRPDGLAGDPQLENQWFRSYRVELAPGQETTVHRHRNPALIVQVTEGSTQVTREDGITAELTRMGDWAWRNAESPYRIKNVGTAPLSVVVNEARRPH
jgi:mannose-6-phosphate isomerase-like protein (cupin superfamily)